MFHCGRPHLKPRKRRAVQPAPKAITFRANGFPQPRFQQNGLELVITAISLIIRYLFRSRVTACQETGSREAGVIST
jgi:hypothetical protein